LYLNGAGAHATAPAVDFGATSFTIASWVKLQSPLNPLSTVFSDWSPPAEKFLVIASHNGKLLFGGYNNIGLFRPWLSAG